MGRVGSADRDVQTARCGSVVMSRGIALRRAIESFHALCYFAPEVSQPYIDAGLHPWAAYFGQRSAPMGAVGAATVSATFYNFNPVLVERSIPSVWHSIDPTRATELRIEGVTAAIRRLTDELPDSDRLLEVARIARRGNDAVVGAGRPLGAAHAATPTPDEPLAAAWWELATLREFRGDGHTTVLVNEGIGPVEALVIAGPFGDMSADEYRRNRGWSAEQWGSGTESARSRGWIASDGSLTESGMNIRTAIETRTDATMEGALAAIGHGLDRLIETIKPVSRTIYRNGGFD